MRTFYAVVLSAFLGNTGCGGGDDEPPPAQDAGAVPDGPVADAPVADGPVADGPVADAPAADAPGADAPTAAPSPTVLATVPADGDTNVDTGMAIAVSFDQPVAAGEPAGAIQLLDELGQPVAGTVEVDGDTLRFVPSVDLALLGHYTAVVNTTVADLDGNPLAREHRFQFQVRSGAWEPTGTLIEDHYGHPQTPDVAMDPVGNVIAVWSQTGSPYSIWANHYDARTRRWQTAQLLECDDTGDALLPRIGMDASGDAMVVWQQSDGTRTHVWASRYDGVGWEDPVRLDVSQTGNARAPRVAVNAAGTAVVVWQQFEGTTAQAWFNRYEEGAGWSGAEPVYVFGAPATVSASQGPLVGIDSQGDALVFLLSAGFSLRGVPHSADSGWGEAEDVLFGPIDDLTLVMNPAGTALGLWNHQQPSRILAWRRESDGRTRINELMAVSEEDRGNVDMGDVAMNPSGDSVAVWFQHSPWPPQVWAGSYSVATETWGEPEGLLPYEASDFENAQVGMDPRGSAHVSWTAGDGNERVLMVTRRAGQSPFSETQVHPGIDDAQLAVNPQGKAVLIRSVRTSTGSGTRIDLDAVLFR